MQIGGPGDASHDDENTEDFDPDPNHSDGVIGQRFEIFEGVRLVHVGASSGAPVCAPAAPADLPKPILPAHCYFAFTLEVIEVITLDAILNWSLRFSIPCRRAIQSKSV